MEKNTLLAIVLSMVVLFGFYIVQGLLFPQSRDQITQHSPPGSGAPPAAEIPQHVSPVSEQQPPVFDSLPVPSAAAGSFSASEDGGPLTEQRITIETELLRVVLTNAGGDVVSFQLKEHRDGDGFVEMVLSGNNEARAFTIALGGLNTQPLTDLFHVEQMSQHSVTFSRVYSISNDENSRFTLSKKYDFLPDEYMFQLTVSLDGGFTMPGFNFGGSAYTLSFGPQIGPRFEKLDGRQDFRQYFTFVNGRRSRPERAGEAAIISTSPQWAAVSGKYFAGIAIPLLPLYDLNFSERPEPGIPSASRLNIIRSPVNSSRQEDVYRFYLGPKSQETLNIYNTGNNGFNLVNLQITEVANTRGFLRPVEIVLRWLLLLFFRLIPNYGIAIILVTLTVKIVFFPLTKKSSEATLRMQALAPKIKELQEKYKDNRQKLNMEMAEFYKKEGYNPLSGCLPMLLQIPIFFAMYNLFNNYFELRNAMFIPGWIPDLSVPESIWDFPEGVRLPLLGWTALRLLPFIYVGSQLLYGKVTQVPGQQSNNQMKMMLYVMPIMFFFILYNVPSGLLLYWIFSNLLTMAQQVGINKLNAKKREAADAEAAEKNASANAPPNKKKKK